MLKLIRGLVVSVAVLVGGACVSPTHAASADIMITQIQAGGAGAALQEIVILFNNASNEVDITNWCLKNKSNIEFACFTPSATSDRIILPAHAYATIGSTTAATYLSYTTLSLIYTVTNSSSGSIIGSSDTISLLSNDKTVVDSHSWTTSISGGMVFSRRIIAAEPTQFGDSDSSTDWTVQIAQPIPDSQIISREVWIDECPNLEDLQLSVPDDMEVDEQGECVPVIFTTPLLPIRITELLPNASGSDTGKEFIELYNPNELTVSLSGYILWYGPEFDASVRLPELEIAGKSYVSFTNGGLDFSLLNSSSRVRLTYGDELIDETTSYIDPKDNMAWALIDDVWLYTNRPTPGSENLISQDDTIDSIEVVGLKPCAENQYRSTETNRCRNVTSITNTITPCKDNQYRSEETYRCRNIVSETVAACKEGQERNPDTNRCRNIVKDSKTDYAVLGAQTSSDGNRWYVWVAIGGVILLAITYSVWEWRYEIRKLFIRTRKLVRIRK